MVGGTLVIGLVSGLTIGLLAAGLVLVYKANRFINLAHAQLGAASSALVAKWVLDGGWSFWVAFAVAVLIGALTGVLVEVLLIAPIRRTARSPLVLLLATTGIAQLLLVLAYIPALGPDRDNMAAYPQPSSASVTVGGVVLSGMDIVTLVLAPAVILALGGFLKFSSLGRQLRASASNPEAARLCGVSSTAVSRLAWGLAGGMSATAAVLAAPSQGGYDLAALGPYLLMVTLGAAAFGAFASMPGALLGGLVLGVVGRVVAEETSNEATAQVAMLGVVLVVVLLRGRAIGAVFGAAGSAAPERPPLRITPRVRRTAVYRTQRLLSQPGALLIAVALPFVPGLEQNGDRFILVLVVVYALVGVSLTMLLGWAGQVSLGHWAIVGVGAFVASRLILEGWSLFAILLVGGALGALALLVVGIPALRVRGFSLAVTTLGLAVIAPNWLFQNERLVPPGTSGVTVVPPALADGLSAPVSQLSTYYIALAVLVLTVAAAAALRRSGSVRAVIAVRDNERASLALGLLPSTIKVSILATSGFVAGVAGVLYAASYRFVSPTQFTADISIAVLAIPVVGGLGSVRGAVAAAVLLYLPTLVLLPRLGDALGNFAAGPGVTLLVAGLALVVALRKLPQGIAGAALDAWQRILDKAARSASEPGPGDLAFGTVAALHQHDDGALGSRRHASPSRIERLALPRGRSDVDRRHPLEVEGIRWHVGGVQVLDDPRIEVRPGEIVGLIGPNGAGKTTLMNVVSGLVTPDAGETWIFGTPMHGLGADYRAAFAVARSFQDASLFAGLTVTETIQVALSRDFRTSVLSQAIGAPWTRFAERRCTSEARRIVAAFGLEPWADALTSEIPTGTRRICDLAAQVATRPRFLMLDEPTAGVAQRDAEAFGPLLKRLRDELACAILIIEHDMPLLMGVCDRVYAMAAGRVVAEGTPAEVRRNPAVVSSYLGTDATAIERSGRRTGELAAASTTPDAENPR